jgi:hypothetical protein
MLIRRLVFLIKKFYYSFSDYFYHLGLSFNYLLFIIISALAVVFLSYNIYKTVNKAESNYRVKQEEAQKRDKLLEESKALDKQIEYMQSVEAKRNSAIDGFQLAAPGDKLYKIEEPQVAADYVEEENLDPINLEDNTYWWEMLVLGKR